MGCLSGGFFERFFLRSFQVIFELLLAAYLSPLFNIIYIIYY